MLDSIGGADGLLLGGARPAALATNACSTSASVIGASARATRAKSYIAIMPSTGFANGTGLGAEVSKDHA